MQRTLLIKTAIIGFLCLIFAVGLAMIQSLVYERQNYADSVVKEIAEQHVNPQQVITPFILLQTTEMACEKQKKTESVQSLCKQTGSSMQSILPTQTQATEALKVADDVYQRGIYAATSFSGKLNFKQQYNLENNELIGLGRFDVSTSTQKANKTTQNATNAKDKNTTQQLNSDSKSNIGNNTKKQAKKSITLVHQQQQTAHLLIPVSDLRGVSQMPVVTINGKTLNAQYPKTPILKEFSYLEVVLPESLATASTLDIDVSLPLSGLTQIKTVPLGYYFTLGMQSDWHAPKFIGQALPNEKSFDDTGFTAKWQNQHLTISNNQLLQGCVDDNKVGCDIRVKSFATGAKVNGGTSRTHYKNDKAEYNSITFNSFDVYFAEPNDVYLQTERSMKYSLLVIAVSFASFFLFEVIKSLRIHPIQYFLVGMALVMFYVLLLSLAEQVTFLQAYLVAATACAGLIGWYAYYVLHSVSRALLFTLILAGQYAGFYLILTSEELNLLIGAVLCFVIIASVMFLTRNIDWYEVS